MNIAKIRTRAKQFRALTSLDVEEFDELLSIFESEWEDWISRFTLSGKPRTRKYSPKSQDGLNSAEEKLFFILSYQKTATLQEFHSASFGLEQDMGNKWVHILSPLLERATRRWHPSQGNYTLSHGQDCSLDGTESPIERPMYEQQDAYSGKKKAHTYKHLLLVALTGAILWLSPCAYGKMHDKKMADLYLRELPAMCRLHLDLGFQGYSPKNAQIEMPEKKPRKKELTKIQKVKNRQKARQRVFVEHAIGHLKTMRIVKDKNRNKKLGYRELVFRTAVQLHNFRCAKRRTILL